MKKIINLNLAILILIASLSFISCGGGSPADRFVDIINGFTEKVEKAKNSRDLNKILQNLSTEDKEYFGNNVDYKLSSSDKQEIKEALINYLVAVGMKGAQFEDESISRPEARQIVEQYYSSLINRIDYCETLGDIGYVFLNLIN